MEKYIYDTVLDFFGCEVPLSVTIVSADPYDTDEEGNRHGYKWRIIKAMAISPVSLDGVDVTKTVIELGDEPILQEAIARIDTWEPVATEKEHELEPVTYANITKFGLSVLDNGSKKPICIRCGGDALNSPYLSGEIFGCNGCGEFEFGKWTT